MLTVGIFFAFWQKVSPDLAFPVKQAGDDASYTEWTEGRKKCYGMRKVGGAKYGIFRTIWSNGTIHEATYSPYYENKLHGLSFTWNCYTNAFLASIYDHGEEKERIIWSDDWSELSKYNNEIILEKALSLFKP